jgi:GH25 family lysozyme M1 (1,4-beta-N-acetylmuramidase)
VPRGLAAFFAVGLAIVLLMFPSAIDARQTPRRTRAAEPTVTPTPTLTPTPTPVPAPGPTPDPTSTPSLSPWGVAGLVDGIDVSDHQGAIDWLAVAGAGKRFAYVRASAGTLTADTAYAVNRSAGLAAGLAIGSYHFGNPDAAPNDASSEAGWFLQHATIAPGDLVPVLDLEVSNGLDQASLTAWAQAWLTQVTMATGVQPVIYTNASFWSSSMADTDWFAANGYRLWVASWTTAAEPTVPAANWGGQGWTFWQHASTGVVPGISGEVDLDRFTVPALPTSLLVP